MPVLGPKETVVFIIFGTFLAKVVALWNMRRDFEWHTVLVTVFGSIMGSIPGGYVLNAIPAAYLQILLGIMLLAVMLLMGRKFEINIQNKTAGRIAAGFISGFSAAMTSISGPPVALYFLAEGRDKTVTRANMCWIFAFGSPWHNGIAVGSRKLHQRRFNAACSLCCTAAAFRHVAW